MRPTSADSGILDRFRTVGARSKRQSFPSRHHGRKPEESGEHQNGGPGDTLIFYHFTFKRGGPSRWPRSLPLHLSVPKTPSHLQVRLRWPSSADDRPDAFPAGYGDVALRAEVAAGGGKRCSASASNRFTAQVEGATQAFQHGSLVPCFFVSLVPFHPRRRLGHPPRDNGAVASLGFSSLLALEVTSASWPATNPGRIARRSYQPGAD